MTGDVCVHMKGVLESAERNGVTIGGCGCCGSPWLSCKTCDRDVEKERWPEPGGSK